MVKPELGSKRVCVSCGARFYDLMRAPAVCPKCGTEQPAETSGLRRGGGNPPERVKKPAVVPGAIEADTDVAAADEEAQEDVLEDTSELEDDADAIGGDLEVETERDETEG